MKSTRGEGFVWREEWMAAAALGFGGGEGTG